MSNFKPLLYERIKSPCIDCESRHLGCHAGCENYTAFLQERNDLKGAYFAHCNGEYSAYKRASIIKSMHRAKQDIYYKVKRK